MKEYGILIGHKIKVKKLKIKTTVLSDDTLNNKSLPVFLTALHKISLNLFSEFHFDTTGLHFYNYKFLCLQNDLTPNLVWSWGCYFVACQQLVGIERFPSSRLVVIPRLKSSVCPAIYSYV